MMVYLQAIVMVNIRNDMASRWQPVRSHLGYLYIYPYIYHHADKYGLDPMMICLRASTALIVRLNNIKA